METAGAILEVPEEPSSRAEIRLVNDMTVDSLSQTHPLQQNSVLVPTVSAQSHSATRGEFSQLDLSGARVLAALAAAILATGPIIWVLVRYWLFAP